MKCRQLTSGAIYEDKVDPRTGEPRGKNRRWIHVHDEKIDAVEDLLEELQGQQLLVATEFGHEAERLRARFGEDLPCIVGRTSDKKAKEYEAAWNSGSIPLLVGHPDSMGHGLNLQGSSAHHILWFSGTWNYELFDQMVRRLLRQGNKASRIFVHHCVFEDTVDESVRASNTRKQRTQEKLFDALKRRR